MKQALLSLAFVIGILLLTPRANAQAYQLPNVNTGCPNTCRVVTWQGGSDLWNSGTLPVYTGATCSPLHEDGVTDDTADLNNCITAANAGTGAYATCHAAGGCAVLIPSGTVFVNGIVRLASSVVLRGIDVSGVGLSTFINLGASGWLTTQNFSFSGSLSPSTSFGTLPSTCSLTGTPQKGDTQVTLGTVSGGCVLSVGSWIKIFGNDDPSIMSANANDGGTVIKEDWGGDNTGFYILQQMVQVLSFASGTGGTGSVVNISKALYYPPDTTTRTVPNTGGVGTINEPAGAKYNVITFGTQKAGYEYLHVTATGDIGAGQIINLQGCLYCWIKGVETQATGSNNASAHMEMDESYGCEIRDSYAHDQRSGAGGSGYGIYWQFSNSDCKIENNILWHNRHGIIFQAGGTGESILFNYLDDQYTDDPTYNGSGRTSHGAHPAMNLYEGNVMSHNAADDCWGTSSHFTFFRNWLWGDFTGNYTLPTSPVISGTYAPVPTATSASDPSGGFDAIDLYTAQTYYNFVGNVLGRAAGGTTHAVWSAATLRTFNANATRANPVVYSYGGAAGTTPGCDTVLNSTAPSSDTTSLNHGNWDYLTNGVAFWEGGANHTLANSIYYTSEPAFLSGKGKPWPLEGPENNPTINTNPAQDCFNAGPGAGHAFDPVGCYAASSSSGNSGLGNGAILSQGAKLQ